MILKQFQYQIQVRPPDRMKKVTNVRLTSKPNGQTLTERPVVEDGSSHFPTLPNPPNSVVNSVTIHHLTVSSVMGLVCQRSPDWIKPRRGRCPPKKPMMRKLRVDTHTIRKTRNMKDWAATMVQTEASHHLTYTAVLMTEPMMKTTSGSLADSMAGDVFCSTKPSSLYG